MSHPTESEVNAAWQAYIAAKDALQADPSSVEKLIRQVNAQFTFRKVFLAWAGTNAA